MTDQLLQSITASGPLAIVLAAAVALLWRKLETQGKEHQEKVDRLRSQHAEEIREERARTDAAQAQYLEFVRQAAQLGESSAP